MIFKTNIKQFNTKRVITLMLGSFMFLCAAYGTENPDFNEARSHHQYSKSGEDILTEAQFLYLAAHICEDIHVKNGVDPVELLKECYRLTNFLIDHKGADFQFNETICSQLKKATFSDLYKLGKIVEHKGIDKCLAELERHNDDPDSSLNVEVIEQSCTILMHALGIFETLGTPALDAKTEVEQQLSIYKQEIIIRTQFGGIWWAKAWKNGKFSS